MSSDTKSVLQTFYGVFFVAIFAFFATLISNLEFFAKLGISPLIIGIILGMIYANSFKKRFSHLFQSGIVFSSKYILRLAIIFYGFRLTFQDLLEVGSSALLIAFLILSLTFVFGYIIGVKILKMDKELAILCSAGSSICGAAAVMATQSVVRNESYKSAVAISFVVIFGTLGMFLLPSLYKLEVLNLSNNEIGIYLGAVLHEVAHVVGASGALGEDIASDAIIVKMIRVIYLVPFLLLLSLFLIKSSDTKQEKAKIMIPWFAIFFILVIAFNSFGLVQEKEIEMINFLDTFALTMAMSALGMDTSIDKFKAVGIKPFYLSFMLFVFLIVLGYILVRFLA